MPRKPLTIVLGYEKDAPRQQASCRLSRAKVTLKELRKHYPQAYIEGQHHLDGGPITQKIDIPSMPKHAPVDWGN